MTEKNKKEKECPLCQVSQETLENLKESGRQKYLLKQKEKERELRWQVGKKRVKKTLMALAVFLVVAGLILGLRFLWQKIPQNQVAEKEKITVFYSPDCSCCHQYVSYLRRNGFDVLEEKEMAKRIEILEKYQIPQDYTACHTSIVGDYFVEGHMPIEIIKKLLEEKPEIDGIALPGMPQGSPGMAGFKTGKWTIYGLSKGRPLEFTTF